ncbi:MAG: nucleotidyltransferase domain-containing protein [Chlamydiae bacterium]|nr:nucleotidyltransferase domain-containing protein [Chlamydiota bacterium]MBI3266917.1 nucleotidyltransferase domain-containing protein [Chlamydiota bacterium]
MPLYEFLKKRRNDILQAALRHGAKNVRLFGSVTRKEENTQSDIDLLVEMEKGRSYLDLVELWQELEELLGKKVDLLTDGGISPYLKDRIYSEAIPL